MTAATSRGVTVTPKNCMNYWRKFLALELMILPDETEYINFHTGIYFGIVKTG